MEQDKRKKRHPNPIENYFFLSRLTFLYFLPTFFQGFFKDFEEDDLPDNLPEDKSELLGEQFQKYWLEELARAEKTKGVSPSLIRVIWRAVKWEFLFQGLVLLFSELGKIVQPLALGQLLMYFTPTSTMSKKEAYFYAAMLILSNFTFMAFANPYRFNIQHIGMKVRIGCSSLVYRKALKMDKSFLLDTSAGKIINVLANDVNRFDTSSIFVHFFWIGPLECSICLYFIIDEIGISSLAGIAFLLFTVCGQYILSMVQGKLRMKIAAKADERLRLMDEIITGIQVIKMFVWEKPFATVIHHHRREELKLIRYTNFIRGIISSLVVYSIRALTTFTVLAYALLGNYLTSKLAYTITLYYNVLRLSISILFARGFSEIWEALTAIKRIEQLLLVKEKHVDSIYENNCLGMEKIGILIENATAKWNSSAPRNTLNDINLTIDSNGLLAVIGSVGAGKSSLFEAILQELPLIKGKIKVQGTISYAPQDSWIFSSSVRQNILFACGLDEERYKKIIKVCGLEQDIESFPHKDMSNVGVRGIKLSGGQKARINLARAVYRNADIYLLDDPLSAVDSEVGQQIFDECFLKFLKDKIVILNTHQLQYLQKADKIIYIDNGEIKRQGTFEELKDLDLMQILAETGLDKKKDKSKGDLDLQTSNQTDSLTFQPANKEIKGTGNIKNTVYTSYFKSGGNFCFQLLIMLSFGLVFAFGLMNDYFLFLWINEEEDYVQRVENLHVNASFMDSTDYSKYLTRNEYIIIYAAIILVLILVPILNSFVFCIFVAKASSNLHDSMLHTIIRAPLRFFAMNSPGQIFNRFSKDMGMVDERLPNALSDALDICFFVIGTIILVCLSNFWMTIPSVITLTLYFLLRMIYLKTSTSIKRLEGTTKSPVFGHVNSSLQGLTTIRCFKAEPVLIREFDHHQNLHSSAWFNFMTASDSLTYALELVNFCYVVVVTIVFLEMDIEDSGNNVGLAITQILMTSGLIQWGVKQSANVENIMTSVERILEYTAIDTERNAESEEDKKPPELWPDKGRIEFKNVFMRYAKEEPNILQGITFTVQEQEKVAVIGRTGAGKSSLVQALLQLAPVDGQILIDGIDISTIGLNDLRRNISIIPQDPVLYSGTIRKNLDPFNEYTDNELWLALDDVDLKRKIVNLIGGLDFKLAERGSNFSVGEKQLICLARAILKNNRILVLDEATANVDLHTDSLIQKTVRRKFVNYTVLTIAHRLSTIMDYDKILVVDKGQIKEFGSPEELLQNRSGYFYEILN